MELIYNCSTVTNFLSLYPKEEWPNCVLAVMLLGITKLNGKFHTVHDL